MTFSLKLHFHLDLNVSFEKSRISLAINIQLDKRENLHKKFKYFVLQSDAECLCHDIEFCPIHEVILLTNKYF